MLRATKLRYSRSRSRRLRRRGVPRRAARNSTCALRFGSRAHRASALSAPGLRRRGRARGERASAALQRFGRSPTQRSRSHLPGRRRGSAGIDGSVGASYVSRAYSNPPVESGTRCGAPPACAGSSRATKPTVELARLPAGPRPMAPIVAGRTPLPAARVGFGGMAPLGRRGSRAACACGRPLRLRCPWHARRGGAVGAAGGAGACRGGDRRPRATPRRRLLCEPGGAVTAAVAAVAAVGPFGDR